jgi:hypothetical protein
LALALLSNLLGYPVKRGLCTCVLPNAAYARKVCGLGTFDEFPIPLNLVLVGYGSNLSVIGFEFNSY